MKLSLSGMAVTLAMLAVNPLGAQRPTVIVDDDDITIRGCISQVNPQSAVPPTILVWSRSDIMLAGATAIGSRLQGPDPAGVSGRVFYWLEDDEDLAKHVGQMVEVKGDLEDFEKGQIEIKRDNGFTEVTLDLGGKEEKVRVPTSWIGATNSNEDQEFDIVARRVDVEDVKVVGSCNRF